MSTICNTYDVPMGLKEEEDFGQEMEASMTILKEEMPMASHNSDEQAETKDPNANGLNSIPDEMTKFNDTGLFPIPPWFPPDQFWKTHSKMINSPLSCGPP